MKRIRNTSDFAILFALNINIRNIAGAPGRNRSGAFLTFIAHCIVAADIDLCYL